MFTACSACTFLKSLLDKTPRTDTEILAAIRKRLGLDQTMNLWKNFTLLCFARRTALQLPRSPEAGHCEIGRGLSPMLLLLCFCMHLFKPEVFINRQVQPEQNHVAEYP